MTKDEKKHDIKTMTVPEAGRLYYDLARNASYAAAKRGEIPVIRVGGRLRVPVIAMERRLIEAASNTANGATEVGHQ